MDAHGTRGHAAASDASPSIPTNPDIVFVAAQGHSYGPQQERGIFRTTDGGKTWQRVLFVDENTGAIDVVMHPTDPQTLFAAMWQLEMHTWGRESGGPGSGIYVSHDGGTTWTQAAGQRTSDASSREDRARDLALESRIASTR